MSEDKLSAGTVTSLKSPLRGTLDKPLRHVVSNEELDALCETRREHVTEYVWGAIGVAVGTLPGTVALLNGYITQGIAYGFRPEGLIQFGLFCAALSVMGSMGMIARRRARRLREIEADIRMRA